MIHVRSTAALALATAAWLASGAGPADGVSTHGQRIVARAPRWDEPPATTGREWRAIVVHHSASSVGNARTFHAWHLGRGWDGLGYHFVIGNGAGMGDGEVAVGWRWVAQREGAHAGETFHNQHGIGICLVGDFESAEPSPAQWAALVGLVRRLALDHAIGADAILGHRQVKQSTACPGGQFPLERLRAELRP